MKSICNRFGGFFEAIGGPETLRGNCRNNRQRILHPVMKFTDDDLL
jgi:hypothetical protein